jgi:CDP-diacylglycerol--glycerol-3-phosphate 3-phosphatidyltransferase
MRFFLWVLTLARLALIPVFIAVASAAQATARAGGDFTVLRWTAVGILFVMGLSDVLDGFVARRFGLVSQAGAVVDAASDKLAQFAVLIFLVVSVGPVFTSIPVWFLAVILGCDLLGLVGWLFLRVRYGPIEVVHRLHGKAVTGMVALVLFLAALGVPESWLMPVVYITAGGALVSIWMYWLEGRARGRRLRESGST